MNIQPVQDVSTNLVAASAIASPLWLERAQGISDIAEWLLAPLGALWLVIQIFFKIREYRRDRRNS